MSDKMDGQSGTSYPLAIMLKWRSSLRFHSLVLFLCVALFACQDGNQSGKPCTSLRLAVTTSTRDSGLLDEILPPFESEENIRIDVLAVGTGAAMELGRKGDVDLIIVHDPSAEELFMKEGSGSRRASLFSNQFILVGPQDDPAGIDGMTPSMALSRLRTVSAPYVSRGDDSGTHRKEKTLFKLAGLETLWRDCIESGRGMGATLIMAHQTQSYVLTDRATFLRFKPKVDLRILVQNHPTLRNPYSAIVIREELRGKENNKGANKLCDYLLSPRTQETIGRFRSGGETPFRPLKTREN